MSLREFAESQGLQVWEVPMMDAETLRKAAEQLREEAHQMVVSSCPHKRICWRDEKNHYLGYKCWDCGEPVTLDIEGNVE